MEPSVCHYATLLRTQALEGDDFLNRTQNLEKKRKAQGREAGSPQFALQGADFSVHGVGRLRGILQLTLQLPAGGVCPLGLLFSLL